MDKKKQIIVLEDDQTRIEWLQEHFPDFNITWHMTVNSFVEDYMSKQWDLVIFDYDLTPDFLQPNFDEEKGWVLNYHQNETARFDYDKDDLNGGDAAKMLPLRNTNQKILVWSANQYGAYQITKMLQEKGYTNVIEQRFQYNGNAELEQKIKEVMLDTKKFSCHNGFEDNGFS